MLVVDLRGDFGEGSGLLDLAGAVMEVSCDW